MVHFSEPPVNGSGGVMNPNNVFGDISGNEQTEANGGAITMFATFYHYTGEFGVPNVDSQFVTVGDGVNSTGVYEGNSNNVIQEAVNSLSGIGGTVFVKEGVYVFDDTVVMPGSVRVLGLGSATIVRPDTTAAFVIRDGYTEIEGLEIQASDTSSSGVGAIELRSISTGQDIRSIKISILSYFMLCMFLTAPA